MSNVNVNRAIAMALAGNYKIGGDGEMMVEDVLWEGNLNNITDTAILSKSIFDYDLIGVFSSSDNSNVTHNNQMQKFVIPEKGNTNTYQFLLNCYLPGSQGSTSPYKFQYEYGMRFGFPTEKTLAMERIYINGWTSPGIFKVVGIKFTGTKSIDYSTEEQVIGKWIDGKPLYQKTLEYTAPSGVIVDLTIFEFTNIKIRSLSYTHNNYTMGDGSYSRFIYPNSTGIKIIYNQGKQMGSNTYYITIQYTKTTD